MKLDIEINTADDTFNTSIDYTPNESIKDVVSNALDEGTLRIEDVTSVVITVELKSGEMV